MKMKSLVVLFVVLSSSLVDVEGKAFRWRPFWWQQNPAHSSEELEYSVDCPDDDYHLSLGANDEHCYVVSTTPMKFNEARDWCRSLAVDADLVSLAKPKVFQDVNTWLSSTVGGSTVWTGAQDESRRDKFVWLQRSFRKFRRVSEKFMQDHWVNGGPANNDYNCATLDVTSKLLQEKACGESHYSVCHYQSTVDSNIFDQEQRADEDFIEKAKEFTPYDPLKINEDSGVLESYNLEEGDILPPAGGSSKRRKKRNAIALASRVWTNGIVPYKFDSTLTSAQIAFVQNAISEIEAATCVRFQAQTTENYYVQFENKANGCFSYIGQTTAAQPINLATGCTLMKGTVQHEIMHALGFYHEQSRMDRDDYVQINWDNIKDGFASQFDKKTSSDMDHIGFCYEYSSVMHYGPTSFSKDSSSLLTIVTTNPAGSVIGQRTAISAQDLQEINKLYGCTNQRIDGGWTEWTGFDTCTQTCGSGTQTRSRSCTCPEPAHGGATCSGSATESQACMTEACPNTLTYEWIGCWEDPNDGVDLLFSLEGSTATLDGQYVDRTDKVEKCAAAAQEVGVTVFALKADGKCYIQTSSQAVDTYKSVGPSSECGTSGTGGSESLSVYTLSSSVIDGEWGAWGAASPCSAACGGGSSTRTRVCDNPQPSAGGATCVGSTTKSESCGTDPCPVDGGYSLWSEWSNCAATCGTGYTRTRTRDCNNPTPTNGGDDCTALGLASETEDCPLGACPVNGGYSLWSDWSDCGATCGTGYTRTRTRDCNNPTPANGGQDCTALGQASETEDCPLGACPVNGGYSLWSDWSDCGATCGTGYTRTRTRDCNNPTPANGGQDCTALGPASETEDCPLGACPVNGGYSLWSDWSDCGATCGTGYTRTRTRDCNNPTPANGGQDCTALGPASETEDCPLGACPVNGGYSLWSDWSDCGATCGTGYTRTRTRDCNNPTPANGGQDCTALGPASETEDCPLGACPVNGGYSLWSDWSDCGATCGTGYTRTRTRDCNNPTPANGGQDCTALGPASETEDCPLGACPVNGGYSLWSDWSDCGATCGTGYTRTRTRDCNNPTPTNGGQDCTALGPASETENCPMGACPEPPVNGVWSLWSGYSVCSESCGSDATKTRTRTCDNPPPSNGGASCVGDKVETVNCNLDPCPGAAVNGGYSAWTTWSLCGATCGNGYTRSRSRVCNNPVPSNGGTDCSGLGQASQTGNCPLPACPVNGNWGAWTSWFPCSVTCGTDSVATTRSRQCNDPAPSNGGAQCRGDSSETKMCTTRPCPGAVLPPNFWYIFHQRILAMHRVMHRLSFMRRRHYRISPIRPFRFISFRRIY